MKKQILSLSLALIALLLLAYPVFAAGVASSTGGCPTGFQLVQAGMHVGEHPHHHIGLAQDLNGDGYLCMKVVAGMLHVHVDNTIP